MTISGEMPWMESAWYSFAGRGKTGESIGPVTKRLGGARPLRAAEKHNQSCCIRPLSCAMYLHGVNEVPRRSNFRPSRA
jgi:hypothetical protein